MMMMLESSQAFHGAHQRPEYMGVLRTSVFT